MTSWQSSGRTPNARVRDGSPDAADDASDCFDPKRAAARPPLEKWLSWEGIRPDTQVILLLLLAARASGELAQRLKLPALLGEILAGVVLGPSLLGLVSPDAGITLLANLGIFSSSTWPPLSSR